MAVLTLYMEVNLKFKGKNICKINANKNKFLRNTEGAKCVFSQMRNVWLETALPHFNTISNGSPK
jgi:hypothetical protein